MQNICFFLYQSLLQTDSWLGYTVSVKITPHIQTTHVISLSDMVLLLRGKKLSTILPARWFCCVCGKRVMVTYVKEEVVGPRRTLMITQWFLRNILHSLQSSYCTIIVNGSKCLKKTDNLQRSKALVLDPAPPLLAWLQACQLSRLCGFIQELRKLTVSAPPVLINNKKVTAMTTTDHQHKINVVFPTINLLLRCKLGLFWHFENMATQPGCHRTQD